ncbi:PRMT5 arginine-N-methyltransferase-domain-containing protein [Kickxella alabastrina]|uniref:PRMT5 arginine-N-methyltransferase-domain-containing protein n=1 Tax=Kickxella alabastrina TaxID=61397 RepID=UPI0022211D5C|nr:PRMT5 arginine-N-methyltransferase-domain-containing protein [Kickxella alabastrina]KAI7829948.1 PRMT5 arginine-N-methyltransferase-domain-containing protein [Kickxella alabastrina]
MAYAKKVVAVGLEPAYTVDDGDTFSRRRWQKQTQILQSYRSHSPQPHNRWRRILHPGLDSIWTPDNVDLVAQQVEYGEHIGLRRVLAPLSEPLKGDAPVVVRLAAHEWRKWNRVRMMCGHNSRLQVALDLDSDPELSLEQWRAEPVQLAIVAEALFIRNAAGFPQMMAIGAAVAVQCGANANSGDHDLDADSAASEAYHDVLQVPLQPLMDHLDADTYATFEADLPKYDAYERALARALSDLTKPEILLMVVGAGRGPLVTRALTAARASSARVRVVAVEKNPGAMVALQQRNVSEWRGELLGSFGDNELSPECLNAAVCSLLCDGGICIPRAYTAYAAPMSSTLLHRRAAEYAAESHTKYSLETPYVVNIHAARLLAEAQPLWTFDHAAAESQRFCRSATADFDVCATAPDSVVHGLAGYFDAELYADVRLSICPSTHTPDMHSWFPMYFPLRQPLAADAGARISVHMWRRCADARTWYEWAVETPAATSGIHNANGHHTPWIKRIFTSGKRKPAASSSTSTSADADAGDKSESNSHSQITLVSFVPKNIFEQFRRAANIYFLFLLILQFIPAVTTGMPGLSALALFTIVLLTMLKDGYEDSKRSASDKEANRAPAVVLGRGWINVNKLPAHMFRAGLFSFLLNDSGAEGSIGGGGSISASSHGAPSKDSAPDMAVDSDAWLQTEWRHLHVGDIVLLHDGESVPADLVLLATSEDDGSCFIETKNLDGETNLKSKVSPPATAHLTSPQHLAAFQCTIDAEPPSTQLPLASNSKEPLSVDNLLLRGSVVRNTQWAVGVTVFTGDETKIMMNAGETPSKRSRIERMMNYQVLSQFCLLFLLCLLSAILGGIYFGRADSFQAVFIVKYQTKSGQSAPLYGFLTFWTALILYQTVVPISLYAYFINQDIDMYYAPTDRRCVPKSWNLSDDLGQNVMEFRQCTIHGKVYGEIIAEKDDGAEGDKAKELRRAMDAKIAKFFNHLHRQSDTTTFLDTSIYDDLQADNAQARAVYEFFTVLSLCHTVISHMPDASQPDRIEYKAQSPDEAALVSTARDDRLLCNFLGNELWFTLLATLEFNSTRKRMSVIVRCDDGRIMLLCKGADSVILERIKDNQEQLRQATLADLELFANQGLRTLCLGYRILEEADYSEWKKQYDHALGSLGDRDAEVEEVCDRIERHLQLVGGTAIEDKLQDGVPETIAQLALAGIKLWVLTGDKTETAINIGYSCNLLNSEMQLIVVKAEDQQATREQLERALHEFGDTHGDLSYVGGGGGAMSGVQAKTRGSWRRLLRGRRSAAKDKMDPAFDHARAIAHNKNRRHGVKGIWDDVRTRNIPSNRANGLQLKRDAPLALVIDGYSLKYALETELAPLFLEIAVRCQSVLCCRVSPLQKALVVRLVKESLGTLCLSIGDGANDVSMIQEADVGIGISGEEGLQAVMASDYAIGQFRFLQKLLLVHGRWSYLRITSMVLNFFYKNIVFTVSLFWFQIYCQWSVSNAFDYALITLYNMLFTMLPPGALGVFDQDLPAFVGVVVPQLYKRGIYKLEYSMARFWMYIADGLYQSAAIIFLIVYSNYFSSSADRSGLDSSNKDDMGTLGAFCVVLVTNLYMGLNNRTWTWVMPLAQLVGIALLLGVFFVYGVMFDSVFSSGAAVRIFVQPNFWLILLLIPIACLMPHYIAKFVRSAWYPTDTDIVREIIHDFRHSRQNSRSWSTTGQSTGVLNSAMSSSRSQKGAPFGAILEHKGMPKSPRRHRHPGAVHSGHMMDGAIPLNDISPHLHGRSLDATAGAAISGDGLNCLGMYQGTRYLESDASLVKYLHNLAHIGSPAESGVPVNNVKRLSVLRQQKQMAADGTLVSSRQAGLEDVSLRPDSGDIYQMTLADGRYMGAISARSSIYNLHDGSLQPHTGYAFAHQEQSSKKR